MNQLLSIFPLAAFGDLSWLLGAAIIIGLIVGALVLVGWILIMIIGMIGGPVLEFADKRKKLSQKEIWTNILLILGGLFMIVAITLIIIWS